MVAASPGVLAVLAYIVVYWVFRLQNPSTYDGNQLSFAFPQMFVTWFQATVTPLPGWNFLRSNDFSSDLPLLSNKLAAFACAQPFYATKALLVGLSVFVFCYPMAVPTEREKLPLGPLMMVCVIGSLSPNLLMSLTIKHQQVADLAYQPYFYSFYSLPFCLFGGLLLFTTLTTQVSVVARLVFIGGGAVLAGILSLSNDFVSSARVSILRDNNLKWRAADHLESSGCLADLPQNALVYAASLDWGADYWSNYFATRTGRKLAISLESPPNIAVPDETPRFVFSYSSSPTGDGYFWQFGPLAGDVEERRKIQIGEYSKRQRYRLAAFVSTDEVFQIEADGTTFCGAKRIRLTGFQSANARADPTTRLRCRSAVKAFRRLRPSRSLLIRQNLWRLIRRSISQRMATVPSVCSQGGPSRKRGAFGLMAIMPHCWFR
jgi:hypothetical protein